MRQIKRNTQAKAGLLSLLLVTQLSYGAVVQMTTLPTITASPGDYKIEETSAALQLAIKSRADIVDKDRAYIASMGREITTLMNELIQKRAQFAKLSQQANTSSIVTLDSYLTLVNDINAKVDSIRLKIQEASLISKDTLPSQAMAIGTTKLDVGSGSLIDMSKEMQGFLDKLESLYNEMNNQTFRILNHKGNIIGSNVSAISGNALAPDLSRFPIMSQAEIDAKSKELQNLLIVSRQTSSQHQLLADILVKNINTMIDQSAVQEFLTFTNQNDNNYRALMFQDIEAVFMMRSYTRLKTGQQIGAIQPMQYPQMIGDLQRMTKAQFLAPIKTALKSIRPQVARSDADLKVAFNSARKFVESYDRMSTPILSQNAEAKREAIEKEYMKKAGRGTFFDRLANMGNKLTAQAKATFASNKEIMSSKKTATTADGIDVSFNSNETGFVSRMSSALTTVTGQQRTVDALLYVMRLAMSDIYEEILLSRGDWSGLQSYHNQLYLANGVQSARTYKMICDYDTTLSVQAKEKIKLLTDGKACAPVPVLAQMNSASGANTKTAIRNLLISYKNVETPRVAQAKNLQMLIEQANAALLEQSNTVDDDSAIFN